MNSPQNMMNSPQNMNHLSLLNSIPNLTDVDLANADLNFDTAAVIDGDGGDLSVSSYSLIMTV